MAQPHDNHDYVGAAPPPKAVRTGPSPAFRILQALASLRVAVILFVLTLVIVFFGTLAQKRDSLNTVLDEYFYCWLAWVDLNLISDFTQVFLKGVRLYGTDEDPGRLRIPFPGGFAIGWAMVINLVAAHIVRFKLTWKRLGIWILHAGVIVLLGGEFIRANYAVEDQMRLSEGQSADFLYSLDRAELVFLRPGGSGADEVVSVPGRIVENAVGGIPIAHPDLPFDVEVVQYMKNTSNPLQQVTAPTPVKFGEKNPATAGLGLVVRLNAEKEVSSIKGERKINLPGCYVTLRDKTSGKPVGTYLFGTEIDELQPVGPDGEWRAAFRLKRTYLAYSIQAIKVERINWPNTDKPKEFKSTVRLENPATQESREVLIEMNRPLRYQGRTYYQSTMDTGGPANLTGFQVVQNPGSHIPYVACSLITLGMAFHFLLKLIDFLNRRARR
jgi:ResB-like family